MTTCNHDLSGKDILLIDTDPILLRLHEAAFARAGCRVYTATDGQTGLCQFYTHRPDLVILEVQLPGLTGWEVCRRMREFSDVPLIIFTVLGDDEAVICGLSGGADDYVIKPCPLNVFMARVQAVLRRAALPPPQSWSSFYRDGYLTLDLAQRQVLVRGQPVSLTQTEYKLLVYLYQHADQVRPHRQIIVDVWGWNEQPKIGVVHLNIQRLRQKLEKAPPA